MLVLHSHKTRTIRHQMHKKGSGVLRKETEQGTPLQSYKVMDVSLDAMMNTKQKRALKVHKLTRCKPKVSK
jgi:hypothetical protein